jgi:hypothetical protein
MNYLESVNRQFQYYESLGRKTMDQLKDEDLTREPVPLVNSISVIVKHLHGNMLSRWTDFLNTDGEKDFRDRDGEFEESLRTREEIMAKWEEGWKVLFDALDGLEESHLSQIVHIRNQGHTVVEAINRQLCHYAYHVGQMVYLGKIFRGDDWESLSIPRNQSKAFNEEKFREDKGRRHFTEDFL